MIKAPLWGNWI